MKTTENEGMQQAPAQKPKDTPQMFSRIGTPDVLVTARPRDLALVTILQRMTTQRWLRVNNPHANHIPLVPHADTTLDPGRKDRAADCMNYEECLEVAATDEITYGQQRVSDHWTCSQACACYLTCAAQTSDATYWIGERRSCDNE